MRRDLALSSYLRFFGTTVLAILVSSCATKKDIREFRQEMQIRHDNAESRLVALERSVARIDTLVREQHSLSQSLRANLGTQSQEQRDNIDLISARQDEINYQLRDLLQRLQAIQLYGGVETTSPKSSASPSGQSSTTTGESKLETPAPSIPMSSKGPKIDPDQLYNTALDDIRNENFQLAESRFLSFLMQFSDHELAGNAQYWLGEAVYGQGKYELAITEYQKVIDKYKKSPKVPAAMLKIGYAYFELGNTKDAPAVLNKLIKTYPKADETKLARERLKKS